MKGTFNHQRGCNHRLRTSVLEFLQMEAQSKRELRWWSKQFFKHMFYGLSTTWGIEGKNSVVLCAWEILNLTPSWSNLLTHERLWGPECQTFCGMILFNMAIWSFSVLWVWPVTAFLESFFCNPEYLIHHCRSRKPKVPINVVFQNHTQLKWEAKTRTW